MPSGFAPDDCTGASGIANPLAKAWDDSGGLAELVRVFSAPGCSALRPS